MTNREKIAEMKVVDFFAKYVFCKGAKTFDDFVVENMNCNNCPNLCGYTGSCDDIITEWLDEKIHPDFTSLENLLKSVEVSE